MSLTEASICLERLGGGFVWKLHAGNPEIQENLLDGEKKVFRIKIFFLCGDMLEPEAECLEAIGTKVLRVFLLAIHSHL